MMTIIYHIIVFYLAVSVLLYLLREEKFWDKVSTAIVLIMLLLRLFLLK